MYSMTSPTPSGKKRFRENFDMLTPEIHVMTDNGLKRTRNIFGKEDINVRNFVSRMTTAIPSPDERKSPFSFSGSPNQKIEMDKSKKEDENNRCTSNLLSRFTGNRNHQLEEPKSFVYSTPTKHDDDVENCHSQLEGLSVSQTEEDTQRIQGNTGLSLKLHENFRKLLSPEEICKLKANNLLHIILTEQNSPVVIGRETFKPVFGNQIQGMDINCLSRKHCIIQLSTSGANGELEQRPRAYARNYSTNGILINKQLIPKSKPHLLKDGDVITLLDASTQNVTLDYVFSDSQENCLFQSRPTSDFATMSSIGIPSTTEQFPVFASTTQSQLPLVPTFSTPHGFSSFDQFSQPMKLSKNLRTIGILLSNPLVYQSSDANQLETMEIAEFNSEYNTIVDAAKESSELKTNMDDECIGYSSSGSHYPQKLFAAFKFATYRGLHDMIALGCRLLHFSGHASDNFIYLEDGRLGTQVVTCKQLKQLLTNEGHGSVRLVVMTTTEISQSANAFVSAGVPHVLEIINSPKDRASISKFLKFFYRGLVQGKSIQQCYDFAIQSSNLVVSESTLKYRLLPEDAEHTEIIFPLISNFQKDPSESNVNSNYPSFISNDILPNVPSRFTGRSYEMHQISALLFDHLGSSTNSDQSNRLISITGPDGVGKSALVKALSRYLSLRRYYPSGIHYFPFDQITRNAANYSPITMKPNHPKDHERTLVKIKKILDSQVKTILIGESGSHSILSKLFILDNCEFFEKTESLLNGFYDILLELLEHYAGLQILLTSRKSFLDASSSFHSISNSSTSSSSSISMDIPSLCSRFKEEVYEIKPLGNFAMATLAINSIPDVVSNLKISDNQIHEIEGNITDQGRLTPENINHPEFIQKLSNSSFITKFNGNPKKLMNMKDK